MLLQGDCLEKLKELDSDSVDSLVTDPPAGISFMGKEWDSDKGGRDGWIAWMTDVMQECMRVMKPGAHGLVWAIPRTSHWTATALENAGFEVRDVVTHLFGSGFPKSLDISKAIDKAAGATREVVGKKPWSNQDTRGNPISGTGGRVAGQQMEKPRLALDLTAPATDEAKQWQGWGTALKPASEHWILVRKPLSEKTVAANVLKHGTGGINIDGSRIKGEYKNQGGGSFATGKFANSNRSNTTKDGLEYIQGNETQGRFPANLVLSHSPYCTDIQCDIECAIRMLDEQSGISKPQHARSMTVNPNESIGTFKTGTRKTSVPADNGGGASRFFYCAKISTRERNEGLDGMPKVLSGAISGKETRPNRPPNHTMRENHHPTVKPKKLMSYLIKLVTPPNGTVLDPFMGSGSTGIAAKENGFKFIGIEKEPEYFEIAEKRIG